MRLEVPRELIEELSNPQRKRTVKAIVQENWRLVEGIDKSLKSVDDVETLVHLPILVAFILQNFRTTINLIVASKRVSVRKQRSKHDNEEVLKFEDDLREAQKDWKVFFSKYEDTINHVAQIAKQEGKVDFHSELWQETRFQKLVSFITNFFNKVHSNTVYYIPPTRLVFALIAFTVNWTVLPAFRVCGKILNIVAKPLKLLKREKIKFNTNGIRIGNKMVVQNGKDLETVRRTSKPNSLVNSPLADENCTKFHLNIENSGRLLSEKEREWQGKTTQFQKEIRSRLEAQERRLVEEIETFEEEKLKRRKEEEEEFRSRLQRQNTDFEHLIKKIEEDMKTLEAEEDEKLSEICEAQDKALFDLLDSAPLASFHWTDHEDFFNDRLQILRNSLCSVRAEYWNFENYIKQSLVAPEQTPNFVKIVCKMESASFGRKVTRAKAIIDDEQELFDTLSDKYADDLFLKVLKKTTNNVSSQLERVILELWNVAVDAEDVTDLRSAVLDIDPYSIPTTWRLKGICNSANVALHDEPLHGNGSANGNGHF